MTQAPDFFSEFPPVSKKEWLARIAAELRGKPLDDLYWHLNGGLTVDPFGHADDFAQPPVPLGVPGGWAINEDVAVGSATDGNRQALEALSFGAESLAFALDALPEAAILEELLQGIYLDHISLHFGGVGIRKAPAVLLAALAAQAKQTNLSTQQIRGSLLYDPIPATPEQLADWRYCVDMIRFAQAELPGFRCITIDGRSDFSGPEGAVSELAAVLAKGRACLGNLAGRGLSADETAAQMQFALSVGTSYFVEIAKLRALKILWMNVLKAYGAKPVYPVLDVRFSPDAYTGELYINMIRGTTMAMSAVLGGASRLTVLPYDAGREEQATYPGSFARRIARNVQHLLKQESSFDQMADPAAGSYYIEKLTAQLAQAAWEQLGRQT